MAISSLKDFYFDELSDLYDAELQMIRTLARLAEAARAPELREALRKHGDESRLHLERLELIFTHWGERRRAKVCVGLAGIVQEADDRLTQDATDDARDAGIIGAAQRIEHYEIAGYGCARTYARRLNRPDQARLLQETLDEERRADRSLTEIAEAHLNSDVRPEVDVRETAARGATVPPQRAERFSADGRRFVDERALDREHAVARDDEALRPSSEGESYMPPQEDKLR
jgi:ferritin-like metal-binding protein YciE